MHIVSLDSRSCHIDLATILAIPPIHFESSDIDRNRRILLNARLHLFNTNRHLFIARQFLLADWVRRLLLDRNYALAIWR